MNEYLQLHIKAIIQETPDTKTFVLEPVNNEPVIYQAGQFLTLIFEHYGHEVRRSYSLFSSPVTDTNLMITVKRVTNGEISRLMLDNLQVGDILQSLPPSGKFTLRETTENIPKDIFLFAAGSGIIPIFAMLKTLLYRNSQDSIKLIYNNRNEQNTIFWKELNELNEKYPNFKFIPLFSNPSDDWQGTSARLNNYMTEKLVRENIQHNPENAEFYMCAPFALMRIIKFTLVFMGFLSEQIFQEEFVIQPFQNTQPIDYDAPPKTVHIKLQNEQFTLAVPPYKTILEVALANNIHMPYSCRGGRCSACSAICKEGKVMMAINQVLTDKDLAEGWILTCTAKPESDVVSIEL